MTEQIYRVRVKIKCTTILKKKKKKSNKEIETYLPTVSNICEVEHRAPRGHLLKFSFNARQLSAEICFFSI